jgi:hypothetical protein
MNSNDAPLFAGLIYIYRCTSVVHTSAVHTFSASSVMLDRLNIRYT